MKNELEIEFQMNEIFGFDREPERSREASAQKSTDAIDAFFEHLELQKALGCGADDFEKLVAERISVPDREPRELTEFREFVKAEKARVPAMTTRQVRSSVVNVLRKAADAMAGL